jgi:hypothetical protein
MKTLLAVLYQVVLCVTAQFWEKQQQGTGHSPPLVGEFSFVAKNATLYRYGGCDIDFANYSNDVWAFDTTGAAGWNLIRTTGPRPPGSCGHGAAVVGDRMFVYGGLAKEGAGGFFALDLVTMTWSNLTCHGICPPARALIQHGLLSAPDGSLILACGTSDDAADDGAAWQYTPSAGSWRKIPATEGRDQRATVGGCSAVAMKTQSGFKILVLGGYDKGVLPTFTEIDPIGRAGPVNYTGSTPGGLAFQGAVTVGTRCMLIEGGFGTAKLLAEPYLFVDAGGSGEWRALHPGLPAPPPHFASGLVAVSHAKAQSLYALGGRIHPAGKDEELWSGLWRLDVTALVTGCV